MTKRLLEQYPFQIRSLTIEEGGGYLIEFYDVPGCISDGDTPEEAIVNGRDALKSCLDDERIRRRHTKAGHLTGRRKRLPVPRSSHGAHPSATRLR